MKVGVPAEEAEEREPGHREGQQQDQDVLGRVGEPRNSCKDK